MYFEKRHDDTLLSSSTKQKYVFKNNKNILVMSILSDKITSPNTNEEIHKLQTYKDNDLYVTRITNSYATIKHIKEFSKLSQNEQNEIVLNIENTLTRYSDNKENSIKIFIDNLQDINNLYSFLKRENKNISLLDKAYYICINEIASTVHIG